MADDGMLLNFEIGDVPLKTHVKFTGGKWRDRVRAQKSANRSQSKPASTDAKNAPRASRSRHDHDDSSRPKKRQRTDGDAHNSASVPQQTPRPNTGGKHGQVTSRLFTANPLPTTVFDDNPPVAEEVEPVKPSNAPLSEEAGNFLALGLSRRLAQHLSTKLEMKAPTAIQKNTIPKLVQEDSDAFLQAETGSGKTLAYLLPIVQRIVALSMNQDGTSKETKIHRNSGLFAIILAPTRELCKQIAVVLEKVLRCAPWLVSTTVIGGESKKSEKARLRKGVNILIATPGRLTDHLDNTKVLDVSTTRWLILDEGDRMMEMGFEDDIRTIVGKIRQDKLKEMNSEGVQLHAALPSRRVTVLCSATMKMNVQKLGEISLEDAVHITAQTDGDEQVGSINEAVFAAPSQLKQSYIIVPAKLRLVTLIALLRSTFARRGSVMKAMIFISCADSVNFHFDLLKTTAPANTESESAAAGDSAKTKSTVAPAAYITSPANPKIVLHKLHGSLAQPVRTSTLQSFAKCTDPCILITTDISSRGLDVPAVDLVVEYDPAFAVADHVHRIGRTARAGRAGKAVLFLLPGCEEGYISFLHSSTAITPQLYDSVLQKGLAAPLDLPPTGNHDYQQPEKQSWTGRAEALQLHFEQRLLVRPEEPEEESKSKGSKDDKGRRRPAKPRDDPLLDAARRAFRSHIRAYATHTKEERACFDITLLHLGHVAKSFGLREAPGGIGGGVPRRTHKGPASHGAGNSASGGGSRKRPADDSDDDMPRRPEQAGADAEAARKMREKMKAVMNVASEFNIG